MATRGGAPLWLRALALLAACQRGAPPAGITLKCEPGALKAARPARAIGVVANRPAIAKHHGVHRAGRLSGLVAHVHKAERRLFVRQRHV